MLGVSIDAFASDIRSSLDKFVLEYKKSNEKTPDLFPLNLPEDNSGLWMELFQDFYFKDSSI